MNYPTKVMKHIRFNKEGTIIQPNTAVLVPLPSVKVTIAQVLQTFCKGIKAAACSREREKLSTVVKNTLLNIQGRSNRYGLYGQSRTGFWPEHKLLILINLIVAWYWVVAAGMNYVSDLKPPIVGDAPNHPSNSVFPMRTYVPLCLKCD